jgi:acetyl esterase
MPLDPMMKLVLDQINSMPPLHTLPVADARAAMDAMVVMMGPGEEVASVDDRTIEAGGQTLTVRRYRPEGLDDAAPTLVFYHGGGFVIGSLQSHDRDCRALANRGRCQVIAVDYRLAPEHPFPAAAEDAITALEHIVANAAELGVDPERVAVGGDSAGGNLAAVAALHARDVGIPLRFQLLIYPAVAHEEGEFPSRADNAEGYALDTDAVRWFMDAYHPGGSPTDWRAAPLLADSHHEVAPALVITAEFDPLRDEGEAYADALQAAGVPAKASRYDGLIHGFFGMGAIVPAANAAVDEAGDALRAAFYDD